MVPSDARPKARFTGEAKEPRPGLSSGHMPHSTSMPFSDLLSPPSSTEPSYKTLLPNDQLRQVLAKALGSEEALNQALRGEVSLFDSAGA